VRKGEIVDMFVLGPRGRSLWTGAQSLYPW